MVLLTLSNRFEFIYLMLDHDEAGECLRNQINEALPHMKIYEISYDKEIKDTGKKIKDPDDYFKKIPKSTNTGIVDKKRNRAAK